MRYHGVDGDLVKGLEKDGLLVATRAQHQHADDIKGGRQKQRLDIVSGRSAVSQHCSLEGCNR